jgi:hypothetical protein
MNLTSLVLPSSLGFRTSEDVRAQVQKICAANPDIAAYHQIGTSEEGRPLDAVVLGQGARRVSLIAGAHSDEPVGPETLREFILQGLTQKQKLTDLFESYQFFIVPQINPDGEARNQRWTTSWPKVEDYLLYVFREPPGRDLEFGFPDMRKENTHVAEFLLDHGPFVMHASLHGMGFAEGAMLLIERHWIERTNNLRVQFKALIKNAGLRLHDHDRKGEKGFIYIEPGFWTTPEGSAMRAYFEANGDRETALNFHDSSMEFVRKIGGDPLCLVTELPLFIINKEIPNRPAGVPLAYLKFKEKIPELRSKLMAGHSIADELKEYHIQPLDLSAAVRLQLSVVQMGLETHAEHIEHGV